MAENNYYIRRIGQALITILGTITFSYAVIKLMPGGPMQYLASQIRANTQGSVSQQRLNALVELYTNVNPEEGIVEGYFHYLEALLLHGDFGNSIFYGEPVWEVLGPALPWTMFVSLAALVIGTIAIFVIGGFLAVHEGDPYDVVGSYFVMFASSIPYYIVGFVLLFILGYDLGWFPVANRMNPNTTPGLNVPFMLGVIHHASLPILSFALTSWGGLGFRAHCTRVIGEDYVNVAELRGLTDTRIQLRYIGWNSMLPMYTSRMASLAALFSGSVIMERIFRYRGMGWYYYKAVMSRDYQLMMAGIILFAIVTVTALLIADLTYGLIDPRAGQSNENNRTLSWRESLSRLFHRFRSGGGVRSDAPTVGEGDGPGLTGGSDAGDRLSFDVETDRSFIRRHQARNWVDRAILTPLRIVATSPRARVGGLIVLAFVLMGTVGPYVLPEPRPYQADPLLRPLQDLAHPLGTDNVGRDLLYQQIHATRPMLILMGAGGLFTLVAAAFFGGVAGYVGGFVDKVLMTITDIMINIPGLPIVIVLAVLFKDLIAASPAFIGIILAIDNWPNIARQIRSQVLTIRQESHVEASRVLGIPTRSVLMNNVRSRMMPLLTMELVGSMRNIIMESAGLYFLGVLPYSTMNWGVVLQVARNGGALSGVDRFHWLLAPMLFIALLSFGLQLFAQGTDRLFNPRLRARHAATVSTEEGSGGSESTTGDPAD